MLRRFLSLFFMFSLQAAGSPINGSPESLKAYADFKASVAARFGLTLVDGHLPPAVIPSPDCTIEIIGPSEYGDRIFIEITRADVRLFMNTYPGEAAVFSKMPHGFSHSTLTEDCEEEGCDGWWYENQTLFVGDKLLKVSYTGPYSHRTTAIECVLTPL